MVANTPPDADAFCASLPESKDLSLQVFGGFTLAPRIDPSKGMGACDAPMNLLDKLDAAFAPLQPLLKILDLVAHLAQCVLLIPGCITNPFKIPQLLNCLPGLVQKLNDLLALVPALPQAWISVIAMVRDTLVLAASILDCVSKTLQSIQDQIDEITDVLNAANETRDDAIKLQLEESAACARKNAEVQIGVALQSLATIARVLCTVRALLCLVPGGKEVAKNIAIPDLTGEVDLTAAINGVNTARDVLTAAVELIEALAGGIAIPTPTPAFSCPAVDDLPDTDAEPDLPDTAEIVTITDVVDPPTIFYFGVPLPASIPAAASPAPDFPIVINGTGFSETSQVYAGADLVPATKVSFVSPTRLIVQLPGTLRTNPSLIQFAVVNQGAAGTTAIGGIPTFGGISAEQPPTEEDPTVTVSDQAQVAVV